MIHRSAQALLRRLSAREAQPSKLADALLDADAVLKLEPHNKEAVAAQQRMLPPPPPRDEAMADAERDGP